MRPALSRKNAWERLPRFPKKVLGPLLGRVPLPYLLGPQFRKALRFVEVAQWWPAERSRAHQLAALQRICRIAYEATSYYRGVLTDAGFHPGDLQSIEDLRALPTLTSATVRQHLAEMCAVPVQSPNVDYTSTAGTSGAPLGFYIGAQRSYIEYAYLVSSWQRIGFQLGVPLAVFRGRRVEEDSARLRHEYDPLLRHHCYSNFHMTDDNMRRYLEHMRGLGSCFLHVYPSSAATLARFIRRAGSEPPANIRAIIAESEIVYPEQRKMIEETFGRRLFACYGMTEKVVAAAECERSTDYHVWPTYGLCELLDDQGEPITTPGCRGEIVGTSFINTVVPFIRYRTGDYATFVGDRCDSCGRAHMVLSDIQGHRIQEHLVAADGSLVSWTALNMHDDTFQNVTQFRFWQDTPGTAVLQVVPAKGFGDADRERICDRLGRKVGHCLEIHVELTSCILPSASGKAIYVDQRIAGMGSAPCTQDRPSPSIDVEGDRS
jgi:phenylacetate-CoA ligase